MNISPAILPQAEAARAVSNVLGAIVFHELLKPLASALGPAGDVFAGRLADRVFVRPAR